MRTARTVLLIDNIIIILSNQKETMIHTNNIYRKRCWHFEEYTTMPQPKRSRRLKREVSFAATTEAISEIPTAGQELKWYTQEEYRSFQQTAEAQVQRLRNLMSSGVRLKLDNDFCECIGIEKFLSPDLLQESSTRKRAHFDAVLPSQRFWNIGMLAYIAESSSEWARTRAHELAIMYTELSAHHEYVR